ncbi:MAG TPA: hypothetical protein PKH23_03410 [Bacillota bacterium]|nr:hypothetical protein [Bacillota bacterium]
MSQNELIKLGILLPDGSINKTKINYIAGEMTQPFAEMVWVSVNHDPETITRLTQLFMDMRKLKLPTLFFSLIDNLYALMGLQMPDNVLPLLQNVEALNYFFFSFINDFGEIMQENFDEIRT